MELPENALVLSWLISAIFCVLIPLITFGSARIANKANDENGDNNDNNNDDENRENGCRWWQWGCNENNDQEEGEQENGGPWWWFWNEREPQEGPNGTLIFVYLWSLGFFAALVFFGYRVLKNQGDLNGLVAVLIVYANFSFLSMLYLGGLEGGVQSEGPELEEDGWYGQLGVMMFLTNLFFTIYSAVFAVLFRRKAADAAVTKIEIEPSDYQTYSEPKVTITDKETV